MEPLNIILVGPSATIFSDDLLDELDFIWEEYAMASDDELEAGALLLKYTLLTLADEIDRVRVAK